MAAASAFRLSWIIVCVGNQALKRYLCYCVSPIDEILALDSVLLVKPRKNLKKIMTKLKEKNRVNKLLKMHSTVSSGQFNQEEISIKKVK